MNDAILHLSSTLADLVHNITLSVIDAVLHLFYHLLDSVITNTLVLAISTIRFIVSAGWPIYPLGYVFGHLLGSCMRLFCI